MEILKCSGARSSTRGNNNLKHHCFVCTTLLKVLNMGIGDVFLRTKTGKSTVCIHLTHFPPSVSSQKGADLFMIFSVDNAFSHDQMFTSVMQNGVQHSPTICV